MMIDRLCFTIIPSELINYPDRFDYLKKYSPWPTFLKVFSNALKIDRVLLYPFEAHFQDLKKQLKDFGVHFDEVNNNQGVKCIELSIKNYLQFNQEVEDGDLYGNEFHEDPELYSGEAFVAEVISHEYQLCLFKIDDSLGQVVDGLSSLLVEKGLKSSDEPNEFGMKIEEIIDVLSRELYC